MTTEINPIEAVQTIISAMKEIETKYFEASKRMKELSEKQNDLVHAFELNLTEEEILSVGSALIKLRKERRETKDLLITLSEAKNFVGDNYKFMSEGSELVKKMKNTKEKASTRKYFVRNCEAIREVLDVTKYTERFSVDEAPKQIEKAKEAVAVVAEERLSAVDKFNKKWGFKK